jgi:hypothetical protein
VDRNTDIIYGKRTKHIYKLWGLLHPNGNARDWQPK